MMDERVKCHFSKNKIDMTSKMMRWNALMAQDETAETCSQFDNLTSMIRGKPRISVREGHMNIARRADAIRAAIEGVSYTLESKD